MEEWPFISSSLLYGCVLSFFIKVMMMMMDGWMDGWMDAIAIIIKSCYIHYALKCSKFEGGLAWEGAWKNYAV